MTRKLLLLASSILALASIAACGGNGGKNAKIDSFTANPSIVPTLGGEVTLVWDVRGADKIEILPDVGVVTGTSLTLTVTETTEFTLVAKRDGSSRRKKTTVTVTEPNMVVGTVRSMANNVTMADIVVVILGHDPVVTDANGMFAVADVATPYQLLLLAPQGASLSILYDGLTRFDPVLDFPLGIEFAANYRQTNVTGNVAGVLAGTTTQVTVDTDVMLSELVFTPAVADNGTGFYDAEYFWADGPTNPPATVHALRYGSSPITSYLYGSAETTLLDGGVVGGVNLTLSSAGAATTTFAYENLDDFVPQTAIATMLLGTPTGTAADQGFPIPDEAYVYGTAFTLSLTVPDIQDAFVVQTAAYQDGFGGYGFDIQTVPVGTEWVDVTVHAPPRLLTPVDEGVVTPESIFNVSAQPASAKMYFFSLQGIGPGGHTLVLVTTKNSVTIPDVKEIGVDLDQMAEVTWFVAEIAPRTTLDEIAGPGGILGSNPEFFGSTVEHIAYFPANAN